ncbi:hypothetical protein ACQ4N7_28355 [Nodosilinea sp. AN01ver1]|uniref:hypothetical protein n=1 Tax=Nodosilinea sp. AN01ver1 TaxID=3423362 RepID=UPI003D310582
MSEPKISRAKADFQMMLWEKEAENTSSVDLYLKLQKLELPEEVASRLHGLLNHTHKIGKKVIQIGKIVLLRIIDFVEKNLFLVAGIGVGVLIGGAVSSLIVSLPIIGAMLTPLAAILQITAVGSGIVLGHDIDKVLPNVGKSVSEIAREFFHFLVDVFIAILDSDNTSLMQA